MRAFPLTAAAFLLLSACAYGPTVRTDFDPSVNFQTYHTYSWIEPAVPQGMNPLMFARVQGSINQALSARGYTQAAPGDFAISFTVGERDRVRVYDYGPGWGGGWGGWGWGCCHGWGWGGWGGWGYSDIDVDQYLERSVVIDIYDNRTKRPIWHGVASNNEYSDRVDYTKLEQAVVAALAKFPPQPQMANR